MNFLTKNSFFCREVGGVFFYKLIRNPNMTKKTFFFLFFIFFWGGGGRGG